MRSIWMKLSLALALLGTVPLALAAGFDCAKAKVAAEQKICADPRLSELDTQMTQAFEQARAKAGPQADALVRDQRNWLGERDDAVVGGNVVPLYQERIAFLQRVFDASPTDAPLLVAMVKHLASQPPGAGARGSDGSVFKSAVEQPYDPTKPLPFDVGLLAKQADQAGLDSSNMTLFRLDTLHLGGLYSVEGTANCEYMTLFSWHDRAVQPIPVPEILQQNCGMLGGSLVEFQGHAYALELDEGSMAASDIEVQRWDGSNWGPMKHVHVRYDYRTLPQYVHCAQTDCAGLIALVSKVLARYLQSRDADALVGHVPADVQEQFETDRKLAVKDNCAVKVDCVGVLPWSGTPKDYYVNHGDDYYGGYRGFDNTSVFFPIRWQGEWLLGRLGHATFGWRSSDDWLLGIWRWDGHAFVPVLGMAAPTRRTGFLLAAWLPDGRLYSN